MTHPPLKTSSSQKKAKPTTTMGGLLCVAVSRKPALRQPLSFSVLGMLALCAQPSGVSASVQARVGGASTQAISQVSGQVSGDDPAEDATARPRESSASSARMALSSSIQLENYPELGRLSVQVPKVVKVLWQKTSQGFSLTLQGVSLQTLGVEQQEGAELRPADHRGGGRRGRQAPPRLHWLRIRESGSDVMISGRWRFPEGAKRLAQPEMEDLRYYQDQGNVLVIDFWERSKLTAKQIVVDRERARLEQVMQTMKQRERVAISAQAKIASSLKAQLEKGVVFEGSLASHFCSQVISEQNDFFLKLWPDHPALKLDRWGARQYPDLHFKYPEPKGRIKQDQYIRTALAMNLAGNYALALRVMEFMHQQFGTRLGSYDKETLLFLRANLLLKLSFFKEGESILAGLSEKRASSDVSLAANQYMAHLYWRRGLVIQALERFLHLIHFFPQAPQAWVFHLAAAELLFQSRQVERAHVEYQFVMDHTQDVEVQAAAALRIADLYFQRQQYEQALVFYDRAAEYFHAQVMQNPSYFLNFGETLLQLGQEVRAKEVFLKSLQEFPNYPAAWRALFRLGEMAGRHYPPEDPKSGRDWYLQTINRFPLSPGATLARLRLLPCHDHGGLDLNATQRFFKIDAEQFNQSSKFPTEEQMNTMVQMTSYSDLRGLARVRALVAMGSITDVSRAVQDELRRVHAPQFKKWVLEIAHDFFRKSILSLLADGKKFEALKIYFAEIVAVPHPFTLPDERHRGSDDFLLKLGNVALEMGLFRLSTELVASFQKWNGMAESMPAKLASGGSASGKGAVAAAEEERDLQSFRAQYKTSEKAYTTAKGLWANWRAATSTMMEALAAESEKKLRDLLAQIKDETPFGFWKHLMAAKLAENKKKNEAAIDHLMKAQALMPRAGDLALGESRDDQAERFVAKLRLNDWLVELALGARGDELAIATLRESESEMLVHEDFVAFLPRFQSVGVNQELDFLLIPLFASLQKNRQKQAEIYERKERWPEVAAVYARSITGQKRKLIQREAISESMTYHYALSLLKSGGLTNQLQAKRLLQELVTPTPVDRQIPEILSTHLPSEAQFWKKLASETLANLSVRQLIDEQ